MSSHDGGGAGSPLREDWIELHNVVPSVEPPAAGVHDAPRGLGLQIPSESSRKTPLPNLRLDTSHLDPPSDALDYSPSDNPPRSAILGLAEGQNLFISNWLSKEDRENSENSGGSRSPSPHSGHRRPSTNGSRSPVSPTVQIVNSRPARRMPHTPRSPTNASATDLESLRPPVGAQISSDTPFERPITPIPQLVVTVEKSFQSTRASEDSPAVSRVSLIDNVFDDSHALEYEDARSDSILRTPDSGLRHRRRSSESSRRQRGRSSESLHPEAVAGFASALRLSPPKYQQSSQPHNLSLSGAAYYAHQDLLSAEESGINDSAAEISSNASIRSQGPPESFIEHSFDDTTHREVEKHIRSQMKEPVGRTLFYFGENNGLRRFLYRVVSSDVCKYTEIILTIVQVAVLCVQNWSAFETTDAGIPIVLNSHIQWTYCGLYVVFTAMAASRCVAFGVLTNEELHWSDIVQQVVWLFRLILHYISLGSIKAPRENPLATNALGHHNCFLRKSWGRVDFISIVFFWAFMGNINAHTLQSLVLIVSGLGHLRILRLLDEIAYTQIVLHVLKTAIPFLQNVFVFIGFFLAVFSVTGLQSFNGSLRRICVYDGLITSQNCGSWFHPDTLEVMPYVLLDKSHGEYIPQSTIKGYTCPAGSKCVELRAFPPGESFSSMANQSFDNIFNALEIVFIMMSNNGFTPLLYDIIDSEYMVSSLFFISGVLLLGIWLMNLLVAVMVSSYSAVRYRFNDQLDETVLVQMSRKAWNVVVGHIFYIGHPSSAKDSGSVSSVSSEEMNPFSTPIRTTAPLARRSPAEMREHGNWILRNTLWGRRYGYIFPIFPLLAVIDLVIQASRAAPNDGLLGWEVGLAAAFGAEILFRFWIYLPYWRYFFFSWTNLMDLTLAIANCIILAWYHDDELYSWLTVFQLLRVYRMIGAVKYSRVFWLQVFGNFRALASLTAFFFLCTFLCTVLAVQMLRGQFEMESDGEINKNSFYDLAVGFFSMYQVASTEDWTDVLFWATDNVARPGDNVAGLACMGILFCGWLFFANFLIFNLFVGIMSESLHGAISNKREAQVKQFFEEVKESQYTQTGPLFGNVLSSFGAFGTEESDDSKPVKIREKLVANIFRFFSPRDPERIVPRPMRAAIERQFVIEFLEAHGNSEQFFEQSEEAKTQTFLSLDFDTSHSYGFDDYLNSSVFHKLQHLFFKFLSWFHHYPSDYRKFLLERLDRQHSTSENSHKAFVEDMYDHNTYALALLNEYCQSHPKFDCPLFVFGRDNGIRKFCQRLVPPCKGARLSNVYPRNWVRFWVRTFFLAATVSIVVQTCINTPLHKLGNGGPESHKTWTYARVLDLVYGIIFTVEFSVKVVADGFHFTPNAYTWSVWNQLDLVVLISIWITFISDLANGVLSRYLRALLALRALRLISFFGRSELLLSSIFNYGLKNILGACLIGMSIVVPYSVWGKNIFHDRLKQCNDDSVEYLSECTGEFVSTVFDHFEILAPRKTEEHYFNYNNFWQALLIQFGVLSLEGWVDVLDAVTSIAGPGKQPSTFASTGNGVYPILYHYIGAVLIMTMLVAVIIRNYALTIGTAYLTEQQLSWLDVKRTLQLLRPTPKPPQYPYGSVRNKLLSIMPTWINSIELWTLFVASVDMASFFYPSRFGQRKIYTLILIACCLLLVCLSILRLVVLKPTLYLHNWWNPYGLIVCSAVTALSIANVVLPDYKASGTLNADRVAQICVLLLWIPRTRKLYQFYTISTAAIGEITMLLRAWFALFVTYAIALNQTFGLTKLGNDSTWSRNFRTVPKALIALFTMSCGEGWNEFLIDFTMKKPYCIENSKRSECGLSGFAYFLFISWNVISMYVFANLFVSLVCEACWYVYRSGPVNINERDIVNLLDSWQQYDVKGTGLIRSSDLHRFLGHTQGYFSLDIFSQDRKYNVHKILEATQNDVRTVVDPYNVDLDSIFEYLADMPVSKYREKRMLYEMFTTQALLTSYAIPGGRGIRFSKLTLLFPLYKDMDPAETLSLKEFISLRVQLHEARVTLAANLIIRRWRLTARKGSHETGLETPGLGYDEDFTHSSKGKSVYWVS